MKSFVEKYQTALAVIGSTIAIIAVIVGSMWTMLSRSDDKFLEQQKQFTEMVEKIGKVDSEARLRDKDLDHKLELLALSKADK